MDVTPAVTASGTAAWGRRRQATAPVLVGNVAPAEVRERIVRNDPERLEWVHALRSDGTEVAPVVAEVEDVGEAFTEPQPAEASLAVVGRRTQFLPVLVGRRRSRAPAGRRYGSGPP